MRVAIVTGAGRGIGKAIATKLAEDGFALTIVSRSAKELASTTSGITRKGGLVISKNLDISQAATAKKIVGDTHREFGRIDVLVNNAGVLGPIGPLESSPVKEWFSTLRVNLGGAYLMCKEVIPIMKKQRGGKIVNLSGAGAPRPYPMFSAYSASKNALLGLTQTLATELAQFNIQVNAVAPGPVHTRLLDKILRSPLPGEDAIAIARRGKREGDRNLHKVAGLVSFLSSEDSGVLTGKVLSSRWDDWGTLRGKRLDELNKSDTFTIRRIDDVFFGAIERARES